MLIERDLLDVGFEFKYIITSPHSEFPKRIYRLENIYLSWSVISNNCNFIELIHRFDQSIQDYTTIDIIPSFKQRVLFSGCISNIEELDLILNLSYNTLTNNKIMSKNKKKKVQISHMGEVVQEIRPATEGLGFQPIVEVQPLNHNPYNEIASLTVKADASISVIDKILQTATWWIFKLPALIRAIKEVIKEYKEFRDSLRVKYDTDNDIQTIFKQSKDQESEIYNSSEVQKVYKETV